MSAMTPVRPSFAILVAVSAVGPLALNIFMPSMPGLAADFGVPYGMVQLTLTLFLLGMAACQLIYGPISDRVGRRPMLLGGFAVFVAASLMAALAPTIEVLIDFYCKHNPAVRDFISERENDPKPIQLQRSRVAAETETE